MTAKAAAVIQQPADAAILKAVRVQLGQAEEKLQIACSLLRGNGFPENAAALTVELKRLRVWTSADGWLSALEKSNLGKGA